MSNQYTESYEEWRDRVGIMPDQDVREAWEHQQEKIRALLTAIRRHRDEFPDQPMEGEYQLWSNLPEHQHEHQDRDQGQESGSSDLWRD